MGILLKQSCFPIKIKIFVCTQPKKLFIKSIGAMDVPTSLANAGLGGGEVCSRSACRGEGRRLGCDILKSPEKRVSKEEAYRSVLPSAR